MLRNYLKSAVRHLIKHKSYTLISLVSLVIGITSFILLMLYAKNELSYDAFQKNSGRIYQIGQFLPTWSVGGTNWTSSGSAYTWVNRETAAVFSGFATRHWPCHRCHS